jgi:hypothetical protein
MKYYRVKPEYDNELRFKFKRGGGLEIDGIDITNELYTKREIEKDREQLRNAESLSEHRRSEIELQRMMAMLKVKNKKK